MSKRIYILFNWVFGHFYLYIYFIYELNTYIFLAWSLFLPVINDRDWRSRTLLPRWSKTILHKPKKRQNLTQKEGAAYSGLGTPLFRGKHNPTHSSDSVFSVCFLCNLFRNLYCWKKPNERTLHFLRIPLQRHPGTRHLKNRLHNQRGLRAARWALLQPRIVFPSEQKVFALERQQTIYWSKKKCRGCEKNVPSVRH